MNKRLFTLIQKYVTKLPPGNFLANLFKTTPDDLFPGDEVEFHSQRSSGYYAIDVVPGTGSRENKVTQYNIDKYSPPAYDEDINLTAESLNFVPAGVSQYDMSTSYAQRLQERILDYIDELKNKILRSRELLCRDVLFYGQMTLISRASINFNFKSTHLYTTPQAWTNDSTDPQEDLRKECQVVQTDSGRVPADSLFGTIALQKLMNNKLFKENANLRRIDRMSLDSPLINDEKAVYHGTIDAYDYKLNVWTYPQQVRVPPGFGLPNEDEDVDIVPADRITIFPKNPDFSLLYAAVPKFDILPENFQQNLGITMGPVGWEAGKLVTSLYEDVLNEALKIRLRSRPFPIPRDKNQIGVIIVT